MALKSLGRDDFQKDIELYLQLIQKGGSKIQKQQTKLTSELDAKIEEIISKAKSSGQVSLDKTSRDLLLLAGRKEILIMSQGLLNKILSDKIDENQTGILRKSEQLGVQISDDLNEIVIKIAQKGFKTSVLDNVDNKDSAEDINKLRFENEELKQKVSEYEKLCGIDTGDQKKPKSGSNTPGSTRQIRAGDLTSTKKSTGLANTTSNRSKSPAIQLNSRLLQQTESNKNSIIARQKEFGDTFGARAAQSAVTQRVLVEAKQAGVKPMHVGQIEDLIDDISKNKIKYDQQCESQGLPRETMGMYLATYLNMRFGLRNLIEETGKSLAYHMNLYQNVSNDVAVFGSLLRNEIDDDFRLIQNQLKETLSHLIHAYLRGKFSNENEALISERHRERLSGSYIENDEWQTAVNFLYNEVDNAHVTSIIKEKIEQERRSLEERQADIDASLHLSRAEKRNRGIILDFQLQKHIEYISPFLELFKKYALPREFTPEEKKAREENGTEDDISSGLIDEEGFINLVSEIDTIIEKPSGKEAVEEILEKIDPMDYRRITFSDV
ncbi:MAG: putative ef hand family protein [Streblomastix strix]|uniref:Putative ef hand family protein n=1 Tax=Streblomastix strix TaxID=222440 RepID=A0A5J4X3U8_9EUKA|nr:MAG: putative ef hand family protein [Streblomastix strix]